MDRKIKWASVVAVVAALLKTLIVFGVDLTDEQAQAVVDLTSSLGALAAVLFAGWFTYSSVTDPSRRETIEDVRAEKRTP